MATPVTGRSTQGAPGLVEVPGNGGAGAIPSRPGGGSRISLAARSRAVRDWSVVRTVRAMVAADAAAVSRMLAQLGYEVAAAPLRRHSDEAGTAVLVAEVDRRVVGMVASRTRWHLHRDGVVTSIDSLVVDQEARSRGVGTDLLAAVCDEAKRVGARVVDLHSHHTRVDARRFYERYGFEVASNYFIKQL